MVCCCKCAPRAAQGAAKGSGGGDSRQPRPPFGGYNNDMNQGLPA